MRIPLTSTKSRSQIRREACVDPGAIADENIKLREKLEDAIGALQNIFGGPSDRPGWRVTWASKEAARALESLGVIQ